MGKDDFRRDDGELIGEKALIVTFWLYKQRKKTKFKKQINDGTQFF